MPRTARKSLGGVIYHVLNRGNGRQRLFHKPADYVAFVALLAQVKQAVPGVRLLAYCLMPNHWHLVLWPRSDGELSRFMQRLQTAHVRRHHAHYAAHASHAGAAGHLYQGRFKSFPVQRDDRHLLTVLRYVESNPLRADPPLARQPAGWNWCSFAARRAAAAAGAVQPVSGSSAAAPAGPTGSRGSAPRDAMPLLDEWPVDVPRNWEALLREPLEDRQREALRQSLRRGRPFGDERWTAATAERLGLAHTLRPRGRPRKRKAGPAERTSDPLGAGAEKRGAKKRGGRKKGTFTFSERPPRMKM